MRIMKLIVALFMFSLFGIFLFASTFTFMEGYNISSDDLTSDSGDELNSTGVYNSLDIIKEMDDDVTSFSSFASGGDDVAITSSTDTSNTAVERSGLSSINRIGYMLFKYPKSILTSVAIFFNLPEEFGTVAYSLLLATIATLLISSVLKNRL